MGNGMLNKAKHPLIHKWIEFRKRNTGTARVENKAFSTSITPLTGYWREFVTGEPKRTPRKRLL